MNSQCRYAAAIIARPIAVVMKPRGGKVLALTLQLLPARSGGPRTHCQQEPTK